MWETLRAILGEATMNEVLLVGLFFVCVMLFGWAPRIGELVGGLFDRDEPPVP